MAIIVSEETPPRKFMKNVLFHVHKFALWFNNIFGLNDFCSSFLGDISDLRCYFRGYSW
ncbi:hypothetical protein ACE6H2_028666 [Prunus campanulata]